MSDREGRETWAAAPRIFMAASLAAFIVATAILLVIDASGAIRVIVGAVVVLSCTISCLWAWRLNAREERAIRLAVRQLIETRTQGEGPTCQRD